MRIAPTAALLNIGPLHLHMESEERRAALRLTQHTICLTTKERKTICAYIRNLHTREDWNENLVLPNQNCTIWFTDGSKTSESSGSGLHNLRTQRKIFISLGRYVTVFQSEICGILGRTLEIASDTVNNNPVYICTESQGTMKALQGNTFCSALVLECRDPLQQPS